MLFMRKKKKKRSSSLGGRRRKMFRIKMVLLASVIVVIIGIFAWLLRLPEVTIHTVNIGGNNITKEEDIRIIADRHLAETYFFLVPKNSEFFLPKKAIKEELEETFTRIEVVTVSLQGGDTLNVEVIERAPNSLWCGTLYLNTEENLGNCYFIDNSSYVYAKAPDFTGNIFFKYFGQLLNEEWSSSTTPLGETVMEQTEFDGITVFLETFKEIGYIPVSFTKNPNGDFSIRMESGVEILYSEGVRLSVILDNLQSVVESDSFSEISQEQLEYIDLRFGSKVYYKLHGEEAIEG